MNFPTDAQICKAVRKSIIETLELGEGDWDVSLPKGYEGELSISQEDGIIFEVSKGEEDPKTFRLKLRISIIED